MKFWFETVPYALTVIMFVFVAAAYIEGLL